MVSKDKLLPAGRGVPSKAEETKNGLHSWSYPVFSYRPVNFQTPRIRRGEIYKSLAKAEEVNVR